MNFIIQKPEAYVQDTELAWESGWTKDMDKYDGREVSSKDFGVGTNYWHFYDGWFWRKDWLVVAPTPN